MTKSLRVGILAGIGIGALAGAAPASADTLPEALAAAYASNPLLLAARAQQRGIDETVPIARAPGLPSITTDTTYTEFVEKSANNFTSPDRVLNAQVQLGVPIYSGGAVRNSIKAAKTRVGAGQADLRGTESAIFSQVVGSYMDVILQESVVRLRRGQVDVLDVNLQATSDRFEIGNLTRTDVAQSQARLALAKGDARSAEANLAAAREIYIQLVGKAPGKLAPPPPLPEAPQTADQAVAIALENNPDIIAAKQQAKASKYDAEVAGSGRLPTISLYSQGSYNDYFDTLGGVAGAGFAQTEKTAQVGARFSLPIFQGGRPAALRRQAQAYATAAMENEIAIERDVIAQTRASFSSWIAAREVIESTQSAIDAAKLSLEGVRAENSVGNRTILDILDAEQELLSTRVRLETARRTAYVAGFSLLAAMGRAEARDLGLDGEILYDPQDNYRRVRGKWFDWDLEPMSEPEATRTIDTQVQDGEVQPR
ncbi:MAG: TolC family outer membrane protein [Sphingomonadaceae bacterium]|nr:TolC family outer membrane protein [Sphingomonadaceae bacterium]